MTSYTKAGVTTNYVYDGDGRRVSKSDSSATLIFVYNASGQLIAEYSSGTLTGTPTTSYLTTDHLGSTRVVTDQNQAVKARHDYLPFGEEIGSDKGGRIGITGYTTNDPTRQRFTSKERDIESGMDYFLARYYLASLGRFTAADAPLIGQHRGDPQSWNLYQYARNNPLLYVDITGEDYVLYEYKYNAEKEAWVRTENTYQVTDIANLPKGYTVYGGNQDGSSLFVQGPNGNRFTAQYAPGDPGGVSVQAQYNISPLADGVFTELSGRASGMNLVIAGFPYITYVGLILEVDSRSRTCEICNAAPIDEGMPFSIGAKGPPLRTIHKMSLKQSSLSFWRGKSTAEIVDSLKPGVKEPLIVKPDGRVMQGNHRIEVLRERGFDVDSLPREILP
jgi:RHS repeat-associated protein